MVYRLKCTTTLHVEYQVRKESATVPVWSAYNKEVQNG